MRVPKNRSARGFSLLELLVVVAIILIITMVALPSFKEAQRHTREMAAIKAIQTIHTAQMQYQSQYGRFASTLAELGPPLSGRPSASSAALISADFAAGKRTGYCFSLQSTEGGYAINASPLSSSSGSRTFYSDETLIIRQSAAPEPATAASPEVSAG